MKIEHLYQFLVIAETGSISKAAQNLFVSQQHLSRIVSSLEETLQCPLLVRNSTGIKLTSYGISFLKYAKKILEDYNEMQTFFYYETLPVAECSKNLEGTCHISIPYFFSLFLNDFISELKTTYPNIELQCSEHTADGPENNCLAKIYLVLGDHFISNELLSLKYRKHLIGNTQTSVCVNSNSPLAYNKRDLCGSNDYRVPAKCSDSAIVCM